MFSIIEGRQHAVDRDLIAFTVEHRIRVFSCFAGFSFPFLLQIKPNLYLYYCFLSFVGRIASLLTSTI